MTDTKTEVCGQGNHVGDATCERSEGHPGKHQASDVKRGDRTVSVWWS